MFIWKNVSYDPRNEKLSVQHICMTIHVEFIMRIRDVPGVLHSIEKDSGQFCSKVEVRGCVYACVGGVGSQRY